jgi:GH24 family phage-related lysozyme (muramidase)
LNVVGERTTVRHCRVVVALLAALVIAALLITPGRSQAAGRVFSGLAVTADGQGYSLTATSGEKYAFGTARAQPNPTGFSGRIVSVAVTGDGRGTMAVSSAGQFYAYGTARPQPNPKGFSGEIVAVALTADGQGAMAVSSAGQFYAYGTARAQPNPNGFSGRIVDVALTADGQGAMAVSSTGQFYAFGNAHPWPNPIGFTGPIVRVSMTADGQGAAALSASGQVYAYGAVPHRGNGDPGSGGGRRRPSELSLSEAGASFIAAYEGFRPTPYNDLANHCTIGYGHLLHRGLCINADRSSWGTISRERGLALLQSDAGVAVNGVRTSLPATPLHQHEFDALVSLTYNIGTQGFSSSSVRRDLSAQPPNYGAVPNDMLLWVRAGSSPSCGLHRRRVNEGRLFSTGFYTIVYPACPYASRSMTTASKRADQMATSATPNTPPAQRPQVHTTSTP